MTLEEKMLEHLVANGMFEHQAAEVIAAVKAEEDSNGTKGMHWGDVVGGESGYPPQMIAALIITVTARALKWVDKHCPKAWYRPMLAGEV